eukprot:3926943-Lingulodinium_polyedra.AAC.1
MGRLVPARCQERARHAKVLVGRCQTTACRRPADSEVAKYNPPRLADTTGNYIGGNGSFLYPCPLRPAL